MAQESTSSSAKKSDQALHIPLKERIKGLPGLIGIRLGESPHYEVLEKDGPVEVRQYGSMVVAKTSVEGPHSEASREAFTRLAAYIFGQNKDGHELAMTAPVVQEAETTGWSLSFILPADVTLENAPAPEDMRIELSHLPPHKVAVYRYGGVNDLDKLHEKTVRLVDWLAHQTRYTSTSEPRCAQYDAPHTLPFFRRNEIWVDVRESLLN